MSAGVQSMRAGATRMAAAAPPNSPPRYSQMMLAPRFCACSRLSMISTPEVGNGGQRTAPGLVGRVGMQMGTTRGAAGVGPTLTPAGPVLRGLWAASGAAPGGSPAPSPITKPSRPWSHGRDARCGSSLR